MSFKIRDKSATRRLAASPRTPAPPSQDEKDAEENVLAQMLEEEPDPRMVLTAPGRVLYANRAAAALFDRADLLQLVRGLVLAVEGDDGWGETFQDSLERAYLERIPAQLIRRVHGRQFQILITPLAHQGDNLAQIRIRDLAALVNAKVALYTRRHALTPAEVLVVNALIKGQTLADLAQEVGIQLSTTRTQMQALLRKSRLARQIDVVNDVHLTWEVAALRPGGAA